MFDIALYMHIQFLQKRYLLFRGIRTNKRTNIESFYKKIKGASYQSEKKESHFFKH
jgi:hypothetical protein